MSIMSEFKAFIMKGNVIDLAVAVVIGVAFNSVITGFVSDLITPLIGIPGHTNFSAIHYTVNGSTFQIGLFINALISFIVIALVVFFLIVKPISKLQERARRQETKAEPVTKTCYECLSQIPAKARRCMYCTSRIK